MQFTDNELDLVCAALHYNKELLAHVGSLRVIINEDTDDFEYVDDEGIRLIAGMIKEAKIVCNQVESTLSTEAIVGALSDKDAGIYGGWEIRFSIVDEDLIRQVHKKIASDAIFPLPEHDLDIGGLIDFVAQQGSNIIVDVTPTGYVYARCYVNASHDGIVPNRDFLVGYIEYDVNKEHYELTLTQQAGTSYSYFREVWWASSYLINTYLFIRNNLNVQSH